MKWSDPAIALCALGVAAFVCLGVTISRSPLVSFDDAAIASASRSFVAGGDGAPTIYPPDSITFPYPLIFGPVFFWLQGHAFNILGVSPAAGRLVPLLSVLAIAAAAATITRTAGGSRRWALAAFGFVMLTPEIGRSATIGRMDTLAVALEMTGLALFASGMRAGRATAVSLGAASGSVWALAALTTPRVFPFLAAVTAAIVVTMRRGSRWEASLSLAQTLSAAAVFCAAIVLWPWHLGLTPAAWAVAVARGALADASVMTSPYGWRDWSSAVFLTGAAAIVPALVMVWLRGRHLRDASAFTVLTAVTGNAAVLMVIGGGNFVPIYFGVPLQIGIIAAAARLFVENRLPRRLIAWGTLVCVVSIVYRVVRHVDTFQVWEARSPAGLNEMVRAHVAPGATVLGYEEFYYFVVEQAGARLITRNNEEFLLEPWRRAWPAVPASAPAQLSAPRPQYLLWPDARPIPVPEAFACAAQHPIARYVPSSNRRSILDPHPGITDWSFWRTYPDTVLYAIPVDCSPLGNSR